MSVDAKRLGATLLDVVRAWVEPAFAAVCRRIDAIESRAPVPGPKGEDGAPGRDGVDGADGEHGKDGADGRSVTLEEVAPMINRVVAEAIARIPPPVAGKDGKDGENGRDGESVHPDTVRSMVADQVRLAVDAIPRPRDGEPGRDATAIDYRDGIDAAASYPRGTHALYRGGIVIAMRATDPLAKMSGDLTAAGWAIALNGVAEEAEEISEDGRTFKRVTIYTNGQSFERQFQTAAMIYQGVWKPGEYVRGDTVTRDGSVWHCEAPTTDEPGKSPAWRLAVKRGNHGRDAK